MQKSRENQITALQSVCLVSHIIIHIVNAEQMPPGKMCEPGNKVRAEMRK